MQKKKEQIWIESRSKLPEGVEFTDVFKVLNFIEHKSLWGKHIECLVVSSHPAILLPLPVIGSLARASVSNGILYLTRSTSPLKASSTWKTGNSWRSP